jgi:tetratricopeptide (TPR) repeat protein
MLRELTKEPGIDPTTPLVLLELALARTANQGAAAPAEADQWLTAAAGLGADPDALTRARARLNLARGTALGKSGAELDKLLRRRPFDIDARILAARVLAAQRDLEAAETLVRQGFYAAEPGREEVATGRLFFAWGEIALKQRKRKMAALHARAGFNRMLGEQRPTVELLATVEFATDIFLRTEQHKLALGMTRELTEALPFHGDAWRLHARALFDAGDSPKAATRAVLKALELDPDNVRALELRAHVAARAGDRKTARDVLARALELETREPDRQRMREFHRRHLGE